MRRINGWRNADETKGQSPVNLLKHLEEVTAALFRENQLFEAERHTLGTKQEQIRRVLDAALNQQWAGIPENTPEYWRVYEAASRRWALARYFVRKALEALPHGFDPTDRLLLHHASLLGDAYDTWFIHWSRAQNGTDFAKELAADDAAGKVGDHLKNHYTVIVPGKGDEKYDQQAFATFFPDDIGAIASRLDEFVEALRFGGGPDKVVVDQYVSYLSHYRTCLAETDIGKLENLWRELDEKWMAIKHWIDIVPDIEYGYGECLRVKVCPQISLRILDADYLEQNKTISQIQDIMVGYFSKRDSDLARNSIGALKKSHAGIYYLPFQSAMSLNFRFSGQSIPNRTEVREKCGVKIYFDPVSTAAREEAVRELIDAVVADAPTRRQSIETLDTLVNHVAAHEVGHAIYSLDSVKDIIKADTKTLLEEPRAELTALHFMKHLLQHGLVDEAGLKRTVGNFVLSDLRRFQMWDSAPTMPYRISAQSCWRRAADIGYLSLNDQGKVVMDDSKVDEFLAACSKQFEAILDAEDKGDGAAIEAVLQDMQSAAEAPIVKHLVNELSTKRAEQ